MKTTYSYLIILLPLVLVSCTQSAPATSTLVHTISFDYEDLQTGESGTVNSFHEQTAGMSSDPGFSESGSTLLGQSSSCNSTIRLYENAETGDPLRFYIRFSTLIPNGIIKPMIGQLYGQLYTYLDPQDFLTDYFPMSIITADDLSSNIIFSRKGDQYSTYFNNQRATDLADSQIRISAHELLRDEHDQLHLSLTVNFDLTTFHPGFSDFPLANQAAYHLSNGEIQFYFPISDPGE